MLDYSMPLMDGGEVCRRVRQYERESGSLHIAKLAILTGNAEQVDPTLEREVGLSALWKKPVEASDICAKTRILLCQ